MKIRSTGLYYKILIIVVIILLCYSLVGEYISSNDKNLILNISYKSNIDDTLQLFYIRKDGKTEFSEIDSLKVELKKSDTFVKAGFDIPLDTTRIRIDFGSKASTIYVDKIEIKKFLGKYTIDAKETFDNAEFNSFIQNEQLVNNALYFETVEGDPFISLNSDIDLYVLQIERRANYYVAAVSVLLALFLCLLMKAIRFVFKNHLFKHIGIFIMDIYGAKRLILRLALNDFKTKYAGSYFGIVWAFVQPIMTILVFWFVFQVGFRSGPVEKVPFILWFMSGLIPWFFYSEAWMSATNCFFEYSYLVKKVLFKISILPLVKILSSWFVHIFFIGVMLIAYAAYGIYPTLYTLQLMYYLICLIFLIIALSFITSSIVIFFKDLGQIMSIILQFGMWLTPIMWSYKSLPEGWRWIFKVNPMYYIIEGYRDSMFNQVWFWDKCNESIWFWVLSLVYFILGFIVFKKLKPHFSDVL